MNLAHFEPAPMNFDRKPANPFVRKILHSAPLSESDVAALTAMSARAPPWPAHSDIVRQDEVTDGALILLTGFACRYRHLPDGQRQILAFLVPGDLCELDCALLGRMDHSIGALTACDVARISSDALDSLTRQHPQIAFALRRAKLADEAISRDWLVSLGRRRGPERLARLLCELLDRQQIVGLADANSCDLPVTQADLADAVGLSTVHVSRSLQTLRSANLVHLAARRLRVLDLPGLHKYCDFSPMYANASAAAALAPEVGVS